VLTTISAAHAKNSICKKNAFHPQNHYFLKINRPIRGCSLRRQLLRNMALPLPRCPPMTRPVFSVPPVQTTETLEKRVTSAESRIQLLEQKLKELSITTKCKGKKAHFSKCVEVEKPQPSPKKRLVKIVTCPPAPLIDKNTETSPPFFSFGKINTEPMINVLPQVKEEEKKETEAEAIPPVQIVVKEEEKQEKLNDAEAKVVIEQTKEETTTEEVDLPLVAQLVAMGFDRSLVRNVTEIYSDIESALEQLLDI